MWQVLIGHGQAQVVMDLNGDVMLILTGADIKKQILVKHNYATMK